MWAGVQSATCKKKGAKKIVEKPGIISVCIDDFALKKRQRYGTEMVDLETHKIVDMIESREMSDVSHWLSECPNMRVVSRDGSLTYAAAIAEINAYYYKLSINIGKNRFDAYIYTIFSRIKGVVRFRRQVHKLLGEECLRNTKKTLKRIDTI